MRLWLCILAQHCYHGQARNDIAADLGSQKQSRFCHGLGGQANVHAGDDQGNSRESSGGYARFAHSLASKRGQAERQRVRDGDRDGDLRRRKRGSEEDRSALVDYQWELQVSPRIRRVGGQEGREAKEGEER